MNILARIESIPLPTSLRRFVVFCGVGTFNAVVGFSLIMFFKIMGFHYLLANFCGYILGVIIGYTTHKNITFRHSKLPEKKLSVLSKNFRKFSLVFTISYAVQFAVLYILVSLLNFWFPIAQIIAIGIYVVVSFFGNSLFTFKKEE